MNEVRHFVAAIIGFHERGRIKERHAQTGAHRRDSVAEIVAGLLTVALHSGQMAKDVNGGGARDGQKGISPAEPPISGNQEQADGGTVHVHDDDLAVELVELPFDVSRQAGGREGVAEVCLYIG